MRSIIIIVLNKRFCRITREHSEQQYNKDNDAKRYSRVLHGRFSTFLLTFNLQQIIQHSNQEKLYLVK